MSKFRNEWKYICSERDIVLLQHRLSGILPYDSHSEGDGTYRIHSMYFDSIFNKCAAENDAGVGERYKWRIRYYGNDTKSLHLERKVKQYGKGYKESCPLTIKMYQRLVDGDYSLIWNTNKKLIQEFCADIMMYGFSPKVIIDYSRTAFIESVSNVRITLDTNIECSDEFDAFLNGDYMCIPVQEKQRHVLEVKFDDILPGYVKSAVTAQRLTLTSFSKYYLGVQTLNEKNV